MNRRNRKRKRNITRPVKSNYWCRNSSNIYDAHVDISSNNNSNGGRKYEDHFKQGLQNSFTYENEKPKKRTILHVNRGRQHQYDSHPYYHKKNFKINEIPHKFYHYGVHNQLQHDRSASASIADFPVAANDLNESDEEPPLKKKQQTSSVYTPSTSGRRVGGSIKNRNKNREKPQERKHAIGFKKLEEILQGCPDDVLLKLLENSAAFCLLLHKPDISPDCICLILQAMTKLADSYFDHNKLQLLHAVTNEDFIDQLIKFISYLPHHSNKDKKRAQYFWQDANKYFLDLNKFSEMVLKVIPTTAIDKLPRLINSVLSSISQLGLSGETQMLFKNLQTKLIDMTKSKEKTASIIGRQDDLQPPDNFREINIFPQAYEIVTNTSPFLRQNIVNGAYKSVEHYLDVQFRLMRNDFVKPLRDGICCYLDKEKQKKVQNIKIYNGVKFLKPDFTSNVANSYLIQLPIPRNKRFQPNFANSRLFMYGSLVCFTKDNFTNILFGRIVERNMELLRDSRLIISLHSIVDKIDFDCKYSMVESKVYFEPYYYVLSALQQINEHDFPMKEYIVDMQSHTRLPSYHFQNTTFDPKNLQRIPIINGIVHNNDWPTAEQLQLNVAQYTAYKNALTRKFAVIQGPPGTGKTYLGLKIAATLLNNASKWHKNKSPMLVICFTNHALDQFLEGLLTTTHNIVRIGGQSKNKNLDQFNIRHIRNRHHLIYDRQHKIKQMAQNLRRYYSLINAIQSFDGIININILLENLPEVKDTWFNNITGEEFIEWLFGRLYNKDPISFDIGTSVLEDTTGAAANEDDTMLQQLPQIFDKKKEYNIEDDTLGVDYSRECIYVKSIQGYDDTFVQMRKEAARLNQLNDQADPRELERLHNIYDQMNSEYNFLKESLKEGKKMTDPQPPRELHLCLQNPQNMPCEDRWRLYFYWLKKCEIRILGSTTVVEANYQKAYKEYEELRMLADMQVLREKLVIGMTTTSAARLQSALRALQSPIVIVEEAAEIMESHIIAALTKHCDHLILIGDHQQLRPSTADYLMQTKYKLGISLFERMVRNKVHCNVLEIQHRMRPEISKLIVPTIYPVLHNHKSVYRFPSVHGIDRNLYFIHHTNLETIERDESKYNLHEVKYLIHLAQYLILNGYEPEDITILCAYSAQLFKMFSERIKYPLLHDIKICVLDNYQGEESKIILLSLVRNNKEGKIGFLKEDNRICVALSRAREGFYIMGNMDMLTNVSAVWEKIKKTLEDQNSLGEALPLRCGVHKDKLTYVKTIEDFRQVAEGGCDQICNAVLQCGHICTIQCHIRNRDHLKSKCREKCMRMLCDEEHVSCSKMCFEECGPCEFPIKRQLKCGHTDTYPCYDKKPNCQKIVTAKLICGHEIKKKCHLSLEDILCPHPCDTRIETCGHACLLKCHIKEDPDHLKYKCKKKCDRIRPKCTSTANEHRCTKSCYEKCDECDIIVRKSRSCDHMHDMKCSVSVELMPCKKPCKKQLACGHHCRLKCDEECGNCIVITEKLVPNCGHKIKIPCKVEPTKNHCLGECTLTLSCKHRCQNRCKDLCTTTCETLVPSVVPLICGHNADIPCAFNKLDQIKSNRSLLKYCTISCDKTLKCGHNCSGTCGECYQGRLHKVCSSECDVSLICGHTCKTPCRQVCPPCKQTCKYRCSHSKCNKKCGEPCTPCKERCTRRCEHQACTKICSEICSVSPCEKPCLKKLKCGHNCIGFCGDPCPRLCKVCDNTALIQFEMEYEYEEDARFVLLEDCKHIIESRVMNEWLAKDGDQIKIKVCPNTCREPLANTSRYSDHFKKSLPNIADVKRKYYGSPEENIRDGEAHITKLKELYDKTNLKIVCPIVTALYETFTAQLKPVKNGKRQMLSKVIVGITNAKIQILENICKLYDDTFHIINKPPTKCLEYFEFLLKRLTTEKERITEQEIDDYELELMRLRRICQFSRISLYSPAHKTKLRSYQNLHDEIYFNGPYNKQEDDNINSKLKGLAHSIGMLDVSESEMRQIVKVIGVRSGAWYKCPNGHPYAIGNCGGANQISNCPDCATTIGGLNHNVVASNSHFNIDGSQFPAWSEQANMANYQLD